MFTVICCSIRPGDAEALRQNIAETIGDVAFDFVAFDNREAGLPIATVYNRCADRARHPYLCFMHEDAAFHTHGWGGLVASQLGQADCGVVGFAGSIVKPARLTAWNVCGRDMRANYVQHMRGRTHLHHTGPDGTDFTRVVTLDGFCFFVRRDVWRQTPFDADACPGFHGYDLDFTLAVAERGYKNYVCLSVTPEHRSEGNYSAAWLDDLRRLHRKWMPRLPLYVPPVAEADLPTWNLRAETGFLKLLMQKGLFASCPLSAVGRHIARHPLNFRAWMLLPKYVKYRLRHRAHPQEHALPTGHKTAGQ